MREIYRFFLISTVMCIVMAVVSAAVSAYALLSTDLEYGPLQGNRASLVPIGIYLFAHPAFPIFVAAGFSYQLLWWERSCRKSEERWAFSAHWIPATRINPPQLYKLCLTLMTVAMVFHTYQALWRAFDVLART